MRRFDPGDPIPMRYEAVDSDGLPIEVSGLLTIKKPDQTTYSAAVETGGVGVLTAVIPAAQAVQRGVYEYLWEISGGLTDVEPGRFYVDDADQESPPLASLAMFARKLGYQPEETEAERAEHLLDAASEEIRDEAGKTWLDAEGALAGVPQRVARICVEVAYRAFTNPEGLSQRSIGDSSKSYDRSGREGGEAVYLTESERRSVRKAAGASTFTAVTMYSGVPEPTMDAWDQVTAE